MSEAVDIKTLLIDEKEVSARRGQTILDVARENDIDFLPSVSWIDRCGRVPPVRR
jgi:NADH dehydrogenase/NADH:ubiquinone oxidoreductase subunit G